MSELAPGILVAAPPLGDPHFDRSVVLLAAHSAEGAFGWIINGQKLMSLSELLVRARVAAEPSDLPGIVRVGGPVSPQQVWLVYRSEHAPDDVHGQFNVGEGITASASLEALESFSKAQPAGQLLAFAGYAGWAPEQLESEIRAGAWLPTDVEASLVFETPSEGLWEHAYSRIGATPMAFVTRTVGSA